MKFLRINNLNSSLNMITENANVNSLIEEILTKLLKDRIVFLIKTDDYLLDNFFLDKLLEHPRFKLGIKKTNIECALHTMAIEELEYAIDLVELNHIEDTTPEFLVAQFQNHQGENKKQVVYVIQKHIFYLFLTNKYAAYFLSCSIFLSEQSLTLIPNVLEKALVSLFDGPISPTFYNYFFLMTRIESISKVVFYAASNKLKFLEFKQKEGISKLQIEPIEGFLNKIGNEFTTSLARLISIETLESFFRAFIFIDRQNFYPLKLSREDLLSFTKASSEELDKLLDLATLPNYQILTEKENLYCFHIPDYFTEWIDLGRWIKNEELSVRQHRQLEVLAQDYFSSFGTLLSKEQVDQTLYWKKENLSSYNWEEKYKLDKDLISSYILLSQNQLEESLAKQQKKRSRLLKNSIRISIAVSIAFLLSSFTALLAYLERNSALKQQEVAIQAKEEADQAKEVAEDERSQAVQARQNESAALKEADIERLIAIESQGQAEFQKNNAFMALEKAMKAEMDASAAREIAEKNEKLANEATETAQINFKTSERLRNQQESRASALEAFSFFDNEDYPKGIQLAQAAYANNLKNGGFPLQSDIFFALISGKLRSEESQLEIDLEFPAKFIALSTTKDKLVVYTINGEIRIYTTQPNLILKKVIKTGYIKSLEFSGDTQILITNLDGDLLTIDILTSRTELYTDPISKTKYKALYRIPEQENNWVATTQAGGVDLLNYQKINGFFKVKEINGGRIQAVDIKEDIIAWAEGKEFYNSSVIMNDKRLLFTAPSEISSITWSNLHGNWVLGLIGGQLVVIDSAGKENLIETFSIHESKVSNLKIIPYTHNTELMLSTGFDGGIYIYVLDRDLPFSTSISSRISFPKHKSWITGFVIDPEKKLAYSISNDRSLKIWPLAIEGLLQKN
jgi:WD40 repeat protein